MADPKRREISEAMSDPNSSHDLRKSPRFSPLNKRTRGSSSVCFFIGEVISDEEARRRWPYRYQNKRHESNNKRSNSCVDDDEDDLILDVKSHYSQAKLLKSVFELGDCVHVKGEKGKKNFVGRIVEFFKTTSDEDYFRVQWFYRAEDTVIGDEARSHDKRRLFISDLMNDNPLDCIVSKVKVIQVLSCVDLISSASPTVDYFYDMKYSIDYTAFSAVVDDPVGLSSCDDMKKLQASEPMPNCWNFSGHKLHKSNMVLLDLFSGCGGMSTGLCLGAKLAGVDLDTRWAVDTDKSACGSLKINHPDAKIRNESAEDFLNLLKEWDKLCSRYVDVKNKTKSSSKCQRRSRSGSQSKSQNSRRKKDDSSDVFEVDSLVDICYGNPNDTGKSKLHFRVHWAGYDSSEDTWESFEELNNCQERVQEFVVEGCKVGILPRPGDADVICGGPPCQGISGYNRFRNVDNPLDDERNRQIVIFMDIVEFLKPIYVLMENVSDILKFADARLGRYAMSRLVRMKYQASLGIMAAGCYGLPQFRLRVFLWGAHPNESLPQFPLPTHDVVLRYGAPCKFERNVVAYDEHQSPNLEKALVIEDAISDLPPVMLLLTFLCLLYFNSCMLIDIAHCPLEVTNNGGKEETAYRKSPETEFQKYIRSRQCDMMGIVDKFTHKRCILYDHRPHSLGEDDYKRVTMIPRRKGANFRDLPGLIIGEDNVVRRDPASDDRLPSGKQLVPDYAINFDKGKSLRPFARLWWDETVPTLLTRPDPHNQAILHPVEDRVLTVRECARLQGFPDYYRFCGTVKERYRQVGNAVAVSVARALGYGLGMAAQKVTKEGFVMSLPPKFSHTSAVDFVKSLEEEK